MLKRLTLIAATTIAASALLTTTATAAVEVRDPNNNYQPCPDTLSLVGTAVYGGCEIPLGTRQNDVFSFWYKWNGNPSSGLGCFIDANVHLGPDGEFFIEDLIVYPGSQGCGDMVSGPDSPIHGHIEVNAGQFTAITDGVDFSSDWSGPLYFNLIDEGDDNWEWDTGEQVLASDPPVEWMVTGILVPDYGEVIDFAEIED